MTAPGTWMQTASHTAFDLLEPHSSQVSLFDIARSLSRTTRFNGHADVAWLGEVNGWVHWNNAAHSNLVAALIDPAAPVALRLAARLHDGHEPYMGDMTSPMKLAMAAVCPEFKAAWAAIEARIQGVVHIAFGLPVTLPDEWNAAIKLADLQARHMEKLAFMSPSPRPWGDLPEPPPWAPVIVARSAGEDERAFYSSVHDEWTLMHDAMGAAA